MKKILAMLLILVLAFGCIGCGNNNEEEPSGEDVTIQQDGEEGTEDSEGTEAEDPEADADGEAGTVTNPEDFYISEDYSEMEAEYDFDMKVADSFALENVVAKVDYRKMADLGAELESRLSASADKALGSAFSVFSDYEEDDEFDIDKLVYAIGMENNDSEGIYLEGGAYHNAPDGKNYQYIIYISRNMYEVSDANTKAIAKDIQSSMGVTLKEKELSKAIKTAFEKGQETLDYFTLYDSASASGSGYSENIRVTVDAFATEDNVIGYYVSCERERCYK